ncbi:MAG TPA: cytochrome C oxidase subunit I, partial [Burkholderiaceae bacterium]|nr:cytochrome C oxidase subunit I [Burkholderiaceae bacterium]
MKEHPAFDARGAEQRAALGQVTAPATRSTIFALAVPADSRRPLALGWLWLGVAALAGSGLFAILLVLARTPQLQHVFPVADFFRVALVVHVDLSVLVWFVAFAGMLWTLAGPPRLLALSWAGLALAALGTVALVAAAFVGDPRPVMANYVPVIDSAIFVFGLQ